MVVGGGRWCGETLETGMILPQSVMKPFPIVKFFLNSGQQINLQENMQNQINPCPVLATFRAEFWGSRRIEETKCQD